MMSGDERLAIVTPTHRNQFGFEEKIILQKSLGHNSDIRHFFAVPENLDEKWLVSNFRTSTVLKFDFNFFESPQSYNKLMLSPFFYEKFEDFKYILILQTDAVLLRRIAPQDYVDFDYVGAPWRKSLRVSIHDGDLHANNKRLFWKPFVRVSVGNGGLSFRNVSSFRELLSDAQVSDFNSRVFDGSHNEDFVISYLIKKRNYRVPSKKRARGVFMEEDLAFCSKVPKILGVHAPNKYNPKLSDEILKQAVNNSG